MSSGLSSNASHFITQNPDFSFLAEDTESRMKHIATLDGTKCNTLYNSKEGQSLCHKSQTLWNRLTPVKCRGLLESDSYATTENPEHHNIWADQWQREETNRIMGEYLRVPGNTQDSDGFQAKLRETQQLVARVFHKK